MQQQLNGTHGRCERCRVYVQFACVPHSRLRGTMYGEKKNQTKESEETDNGVCDRPAWCANAIIVVKQPTTTTKCSYIFAPFNVLRCDCSVLRSTTVHTMADDKKYGDGERAGERERERVLIRSEIEWKSRPSRVEIHRGKAQQSATTTTTFPTRRAAQKWLFYDRIIVDSSVSLCVPILHCIIGWALLHKFSALQQMKYEEPRRRIILLILFIIIFVSLIELWHNERARFAVRPVVILAVSCVSTR